MAIELEKLKQEFELWENGQTSSFDLDEKIHEYHSGAHQSLFNLYSQNSNHFQTVARSAALGLIARTEMSPGLLVKLQPSISFFQANLEPLRVTRTNE